MSTKHTHSRKRRTRHKHSTKKKWGRNRSRSKSKSRRSSGRSMRSTSKSNRTRSHSTKKRRTRTRVKKNGTERLYTRRKSCLRGSGGKYFQGEYYPFDETFHGKEIFRKVNDPDDIQFYYVNEYAVSAILANNPHPNIVNIYRMTKTYIDEEFVKPITNIPKQDIDWEQVAAQMELAKKHLHSLGIMYVDWKIDQIGLGQDHMYKLYDFDASGIVNIETGQWMLEPRSDVWAYTNAMQAGLMTPIEIDNYAFSTLLIKEIQTLK